MRARQWVVASPPLSAERKSPPSKAHPSACRNPSPSIDTSTAPSQILAAQIPRRGNMRILNQVCRIGMGLAALGLSACAAQPPAHTGCAADAMCAPAPADVADVEFNKGAASATLSEHAGKAKTCRTADGPTGVAKVKVTFAPSTGRVTQASVSDPPFAGTDVGDCIASTFRTANVPPFTGLPVSVTKSVTID